MHRDHEKRRPWSLYDEAGEWLGDVDLPEATIRETLPHAVINREVGSIRLMPREVGTGVLVPAAERGWDDG